MDFVSSRRTCESMDFVSFWRNCERMDFVSRLGTPPRRGVEKPEGPSALQPTTEYRISSVFGVTVNLWVSSRQYSAYL